MSRKAANKVEAILEGVGLDTPTINACFTAHPLNAENAVQTGLTKWTEGQGTQPPTWSLLIEAMKYARIPQQDIAALKKALGH